MALDQWARIANANKTKLRKVAEVAIINMVDRVIILSPVATGLFKNNWMVGMNSPDHSTTRFVAKTATGVRGGAVLRRAMAKIRSMKIGDTIHFSNSLPYAWRLEYGYSRKAPAGMVRVTVANWQQEVDKAARMVR